MLTPDAFYLEVDGVRKDVPMEYSIVQYPSLAEFPTVGDVHTLYVDLVSKGVYFWIEEDERYESAYSSGLAATIKVVSTDTVDPDIPASVINIGDATNAKFKFYIPRGQDGPQGAGDMTKAEYATNGVSGVVDTAVSADTADIAGHATTADSATSANSALTAGTAGTANTALTLNGFTEDDFVALAEKNHFTTEIDVAAPGSSQYGAAWWDRIKIGYDAAGAPAIRYHNRMWTETTTPEFFDHILFGGYASG